MRVGLRRIGPLAASCALGLLSVAGTAAAEPALPEGFQDTIAFGNLEQPVAFRFAPDERVFVAEKGGLIKVYDDLEDEEPTVFADLRTQVYDHGDRGLLGLALDPDFPEAPYVYALYTYDHILGEEAPPPKWGKAETVGDECSEPKGADDCVVSGRLVRLTAAAGEDHAEPSAKSPTELVLAEGWCQQFSSHSIGDLHFGPEGALYASGGDGASFTGLDYGQLGEPPNPCGDPPGGFGVKLTPPTAEGGALRAQNLTNLNGKIIRIDPETGKAWPDNPMIASPNETTRKIVAYGFRNPFRFTIDPQTGEIFTGNVGSSELEEIDRFPAPPKATYNSGWPCYEGPVRQFLFVPLGLTVCENLYASEPTSTSPPFFYFSHGQEVVPGDECSYASGSAVGAVDFYEGSAFPAAYKGALFFSDPVRGCVYVMYADEKGEPDPFTTERFMREGQVYPAVDIEEGPDGALYYASIFGDEEFGPGAIHRITYAPGAPTARLTADTQYSPDVEHEFQLDASGSSDPAEEPLDFEWDLDGNGSFEVKGGETQTVKYAEADNAIVAVRVSDGAFDSVARVTLYPGDEPPKPLIELPKPNLEWKVGQKITLIGSAKDFEEKPLTGLSLYWSTRIAHCPNGPENCHKHPLQVFAGLKEASFLAPEHDYPSYIEITLRATDKRGLAASETIQIDPRTVELAMQSNPPGISLTAGLEVEPAPFALTAIEGSNVPVSAPQTATVGGIAYTFQGWSDGGARSHTVLASSSRALEAVYSGPPKPQTRIRRHPQPVTNSHTARFVFSSSLAGSHFRCKLDRKRYRACKSPASYRRLNPGRHKFAVYAIDATGQRDPTPATFPWKIR
jgi:glucose/arabinose dehydrogenase